MYHIFVINDSSGASVVNVDNAYDCDRLKANGAYELTHEEIASAGMSGYEHLVSPINTVINDDGSITFTPPSPPSLTNVHTAKLAEIISGSNACAGSVKSRYTELEIDSWAIQQSQAETVLAGGTLPADALLSVLATANGVPVADFAARVMNNVSTAEAVTKFVVSQQQAYETRLKTIMADSTMDDAAKITAIQGIVIKYELPEA